MGRETAITFVVGIVVGGLLVIGFSARNSGLVEPVNVNTGPAAQMTGELGITFPLENFPVDNPVTVAGTTMVFENQFMASVMDADGKELGSTPVYAYGDIGRPAAFVAEIPFSESTTETGTVEIWDQSAEDGTREVIDSVPVTF